MDRTYVRERVSDRGWRARDQPETGIALRDRHLRGREYFHVDRYGKESLILSDEVRVEVEVELRAGRPPPASGGR